MPRRDIALSRDVALIGLGVVAAGVVPAFFAMPGLQGHLRAIWAIVISIGTLILWLVRPGAACLSVVAWFATLGFQRRLFDLFAASPGVDPLTIAVPIATLFALLLRSTLTPAAAKSSLQRGVLFFLLALSLGLVRSMGGNFLEAIAAFLVIASPLAGYLLVRGRLHADEGRRIALWTLVVATASAAYGLFQQYAGLPEWDLRWVTEQGYAALSVGGETRSFGFSASAQEYVTLLGIGLVMALVLASKRTILFFVPLILMFLVAILNSGSRGGLLFAALGSFVVLAFRMSARPVVIAAITTIAIALSPFLLSLLASIGGSVGVSQKMIDRQVGGLSNPLDADTSTGGLHLDLIAQNLMSAFSNPFGSGIGAARVLGDRNDVSSVSVGMGLIGLISYAALCYLIVRLASRRAVSESRGVADLAAIGVLTVTIGHWVNGSLYISCALIWIFIGWLDSGDLRGRSSESIPELSTGRLLNAA